MNTLTIREAQAIAAAFAPGNPMRLECSPHTDTSILLMYLQHWHPSHEDMVDVLNSLVQRVSFSDNAMNSVCRRLVVDQLLVSVQDVDDDRLKQLEEQEWNDTKDGAA